MGAQEGRSRSSPRRQHGIEAGDTVSLSTEAKVAHLGRQLRVDEMAGVIPALPGIEVGDFDDLIEEAMSDHADEVIRRMREGSS
jgi:hypothetical protein